MSVSFQFKALEQKLFNGFFTMTEAELNSASVVMLEVDASPCYPCRVSLQDAAIGEKILAITFEHHAVDSPYRSTGPIFVRKNARTATPKVNEVPTMLRHRLLSLRGYDRRHMMIEADTTTGHDIEKVLQAQLANQQVEYIHVHNAGPGCFNCSVTRIN